MILAPSIRVLIPISEFLGAQVAPNGSDLLPPCFDASRGLWKHEDFGAEHYDRRTRFERPSFTDVGRETARQTRDTNKTRSLCLVHKGT